MSGILFHWETFQTEGRWYADAVQYRLDFESPKHYHWVIPTHRFRWQARLEAWRRNRRIRKHYRSIGLKLP